MRRFLFVLLALSLLFTFQARGADECGTVFAERYALHDTDYSYGLGQIVRTGSGATRQLWQAGAYVSGTPGGTGAVGWTEVTSDYAPLAVGCSTGTSGLTPETDISYANTQGIAIVYSRPGETVRTISLGGTQNGEVHIVAGSVSSPSGSAGSLNAVSLVSTFGVPTLRFTLGAGASVENLQTSSSSRGVYVGGNGALILRIAGDVSIAGGNAIRADSRANAGSIDMGITGGTHVSGTGSTVRADFLGSGTGAIKISVTGADTRLSQPTSTSSIAVIDMGGKGGADSILVGEGAKVCRGTFNDAGGCDPSGSTAILLGKYVSIGGSMALTNEGSIWGNIRVSAGSVGASVTNRGFFRGNFWALSSSTGADTVLNEGTWILTDDSRFRTGADSFTSSGTLTAEHSGSTLRLRDLETFTLQDGGIFKVSLESNTLPTHAILTLGGATPTLAGIVDLELRDSGTLPTTGTLILFTGTGITSSTSLSNLRLHSRIGGTFSYSNNNIQLAFAAAPAAVANTTCGSSVVRDVVLPGNADKAIICNSSDTLSAATALSVTAAQVAIIYEEDTAGTGSISTISNTGAGGEVHILSGTVNTPSGSGSPDSITLSNSGTMPLRLVLGASASVTNQDTTAGSHAIYVDGGGDVFLDIAGNTSTTAASSYSIFAEAGGSGDVVLRITGGTHTSSGSSSNVVRAQIATSGTGKLDVRISGSTARLVATGTPVIRAAARTGDDVFHIGAGAIVCRGSISANVCTAQSGNVFAFNRASASSTGSLTITNQGSIYGNIHISVGSYNVALTNQPSGSIEGTLTTTQTGNTVAINQGIWTMRGNSNFGGSSGDMDSFTNSGTLIVERASTSPSTIAINNLEAFTLSPEGIVLFSVPNNNAITGALLNIGGAADTLAGIIDVITRDSTALPTSGSYTLIAGTAIAAGAHSNLRLAGHIGGTLSTSTTNIVLTFMAAPANICGSPSARTVSPPGNANMEVLCNAADNLTVNSAVSNSTARVAIIYRGIPNNPTRAIKSITNTGAGGEIHVLSGSVITPDDGGGGAPDSVRLVDLLGTQVLRVVVASDTSVTNRDGTLGSHAIELRGSRNLSLSVGGNVSSRLGRAIFVEASGSGNVDLDITGGMLTSAGSNVVQVSIASGGTGALDVDITGGVVQGGTGSTAAIWLQGIGGADNLHIGRDATVCRGTFSAGSCTPASGLALYFEKRATRAGTVTVTNAGRVWGNVSVTAAGVPTTITNQASGMIVGTFTGGTALDTVSNAGTWTVNGDSDFRGDTDVFRNSGTLIVRYAGAALAMSNLENFILTPASTIRFSLATVSPSTALLDIGAATPTLAGEVQLVLRDDSLTLPTSSSITLITGTALGTPDFARFHLHTDINGYLSVSSNTLQVTFEAPPTSTACGSAVRRRITAPGAAYWEIVCDSTDTLTTSSNITVTDNGVALLYRGTAANGSGAVNSISNTGNGGEIHIESGSITRTTAGDALVIVRASSTDPFRLVTASGTTVSNTHNGLGSSAIYVNVEGDVSMSLAGDTSTVNGNIIVVNSSGNIDLDITGGTHSGPSIVVRPSILSGGTGAIDIDITGGVLHGGSGGVGGALLASTGRTGADSVTIGSGAALCLGAYSAGSCTVGSGNAVYLIKAGTPAGSVTFSNSGSIWGDVRVSAGSIGGAITNEASGAIVGAFIGGAGNDVLSNAGTWTIASDFDFGTNTGDADSFANSGTLIVRYAGTALAMSNLETFATSGTLRFSLADNDLTSLSGALLDIGGATPTLSGTINIATRDGSTIPHFGGVITLITGTTISASTDISGLSVTGVTGALSVDGNNLLFTVRLDPSLLACGAITSRQVTSPGYANMEVVCDSADSLNASSDIARTGERIAIRYRGTQSGGGGSVRSIENTGAGGEIHIESGSVSRADDGEDTAGDAVTLSNAGTNALRLVTASGTSVTNLDTSTGSDAIYVSGGGSVFLEIAGSTSAVGGVAIFAEAGGAGDVDLEITGGTHRGVVDARIANLGTGAIEADISGSAVLFDSGAAPLQLSGRGGADTLDIADGVAICRGTYASESCTVSSGDALLVSKNNSDTGSVTITTAGRIDGDITIGGGGFAVTVTNEAEGVIVGNFTSSSTGTTVVTNEGSWTLSGDATFGGGTSDSFVNEGRLVVQYKGTAISLTGLETFTQATEGILRIEIDPRGENPDDGSNDGLPGSGDALLSVGSASGTVAGTLSVIILDTISAAALGELLATEGDTELSVFASGHSLTTSALQLLGGLQRAEETGAISYALRSLPVGAPAAAAVLATAEQKAAAHTYDSLIQSSWFATRSALVSLGSPGCSVGGAFSQETGILSFLGGGCLWLNNVGGRLSLHERGTPGLKKTEELVVGLVGGLQTSLGELMGYEVFLSTLLGYEFSDIEFDRGVSDGHRVLAGMGVSTSLQTVPLDMFVGLSINHTTYEVARTVESGRISSEPEVLTVGGHGSVAYRLNAAVEGFGEFVIKPSVQIDVVGVMMDSFGEKGGERVGEVEATAVSFTPSVLFSRVDGLRTGALLESWLEVGALVFATDPEFEYEIGNAKTTGTLERALAEVSAGLSLLGQRTEFTVFWDGLFGEDTTSNSVTLKVKYAF